MKFIGLTIPSKKAGDMLSPAIYIVLTCELYPIQVESVNDALRSHSKHFVVSLP